MSVRPFDCRGLLTGKEKGAGKIKLVEKYQCVCVFTAIINLLLTAVNMYKNVNARVPKVCAFCVVGSQFLLGGRSVGHIS